jgi:GNAT superfamily N-acetyltransferase
MPDLSPGWVTDLAVLRHTGSTVEDRGDHLVVRTPDNPQFHWGNCVFMTDEDAVDDVERCLDAFGSAFPSATWVAIGLIRMPADEAPWTERGLKLELDDVLSTRTLPLQLPLAEGYTARRLTGEDWERSVLRALRENERTREYEPRSHERFVRAQAQARRALCERGDAAFFGAFAGDVLVAELGIVRCAKTARYQSVGTDSDHRRRGLASHLLGLAARWAGERGCDQWVIVTEATNPAGRVYRSVGFAPDIGNAQAYRRPPLGSAGPAAGES